MKNHLTTRFPRYPSKLPAQLQAWTTLWWVVEQAMVALLNPFAVLRPVVLLATALRQVQASVSSRDVGGDACLPLDIITLLKSETCDAVAFACQQEIQDGASCSSECYDALQQFRSVRPQPS